MHSRTQKTQPLTFRQFSRRGAALLSCLHKEVRIGVLGAATLACATPRLMAAPLTVVDGRADETADQPADTLALGEAQVSAARVPLQAGLAARPLTVLTRRDLEAAGVITLNDLLKLSAAIDVRQRGGFGVQTDISIDGGTHDQIAIFLNGVPLTHPQTGHLSADFPVNLSDIARVEILEGAASRLMGSQALSGAINVVTRDAAAHASPLHVSAEAGSGNTWRSEARVAHAWGKGWYATGSGSWQRSDGVVENGDFKGGKGYAHLTYEQPDLRLDVQAGATAQDFGANTFYSAAFPNQWEATRRYLLSAKATVRGRICWVPQLSWLRNTDHFQLERGTAAGENYHRADVHTAALNAWTAWRGGRTAVGAELRAENLYSTNLGRELPADQQPAIPGTSGLRYTRRDGRTNLSYFLEHNFLWRSFTLSAGVMAEYNTALSHGFRFYPGIDLSWRLPKGMRLFASWNRSMRLPSFTDLWYKSATQEGNAGLRPEECQAVRVGGDYTGRVATVRVKAHYQRGTDMIDWVMRTPDDIYHATAFSLDTYGLGMDAAWQLSAWWGQRQPFEQFSVSYAWLHQHRRAGEPYFKSNYALEYLRHKLVLGLRHRIVRGLTASWSLSWQARQGAYLLYSHGAPTATLQPYGAHARLDVRLAWAKGRWNVYADLTNLTNHPYYDVGNVRQPGLVALGGARFDW